MNGLERRTLLGAAGIGALAAMSKAGPLNPPAGPVAPTGRTLDEVYNKITAPGTAPVGAYDGRVAIPGGSDAVVITQPGSYVLTGNVLNAGLGYNIIIQSHNVELDLNGFEISGGAGLAGVYIDNALGVVVRNGRIAGFTWGIETSFITGQVLIEDVMLRGNGTMGIMARGRCTVVRRCQVLDLGNASANSTLTGMRLIGECCTVDQCAVTRFFTTATLPTLLGIDMQGVGAAVTRCTITNTAVAAGSKGIQLVAGCSYKDNMVVGMATKYAPNGAFDAGGNA